MFILSFENSKVVQKSNRYTSDTYQHSFPFDNNKQHNTTQRNTAPDTLLQTKLNEFHFKCLFPALFIVRFFLVRHNLHREKKIYYNI